MNTPEIFKAFLRWSNRSLANTFALRAALIAVGSSMVVALISLFVIYWVEQATLQDRLQEKSRRLAERVEGSIVVLEGSVFDLSKNPMFMTALLDSPGRNTYVVPFLENYKFPIAAASGLALCDLNGERLAGMRSPLSECRANSPLFKQVIAEGKILRELVPLKNGHLAWTVYQGVVFPYTGTVEGVVVTQLDLHDILRPVPNDLNLEGVALVRAGSVENLASAEAAGAATASMKTAKTLLFKNTTGAVPFPIEAVARDDLLPFEHKLVPLVLGFGFGSLLLVVLVVYSTRRVSWQLIAPLTELTEIAHQVAESGDLSITVPRIEAGEVGQLANAFEVMVETLRISEATLESKVALRTEELRKSEAAAGAANRAKSDFLATMSHEIRTPMNGILGMAQLLLVPDIGNEERFDYARTILNSGQALLVLLNDILDLSKVESGKLELERAAFDPVQIIHETVALFAEAAHQKGLVVDHVWTGPNQRYWADPTRLRQMLANLVNNAIKFTEQGHVRIEASELHRDANEAVLLFAVSDTGIGIAREKQVLLFQPFSQADPSTTRRYGGTGLGLSIVRNLAKQMGGDVGVESEAGHGARFWFSIRATAIRPEEESRHEGRETKAGNGAALMPEKFSGRILVVEDNPTNRKVIHAMLDKHGIRGDCVENGQQAVDAITGGLVPDLVLMDCQMPVMDGFEATRRIRRWERENARSHVTIVALTAGAFEEDRDRCIAAGMDDFLAKPIAMEKLTAILGCWLSAAGNGTADSVSAPGIKTQENDLPVFDEEKLLALVGDDRELARTIILSAMGDIPNYVELLEQAVAAGNWRDGERATHTMKGLTAQVGGIKLARHLKEVDDRLKRGGKTDSVTLADLRREYQTLAHALQKWLASLAMTTPAPAGKLLATDRIIAMLRELEPLLAQNKFDAISRFKELQEAVVGTEVAAEIAEAGLLAAEFRFDLALERLRRIAAKVGKT